MAYLINQEETLKDSIAKMNNGSRYYGTLYNNYPLIQYGARPLTGYSISPTSSGSSNNSNYQPTVNPNNSWLDQ